VLFDPGIGPETACQNTTMRYALAVIVVLSAAASTATYVRYQSFDPCQWMALDVANDTKQPGTVVAARIRAAFLVDGIITPSPVDCIQAWWKYRADALPEKS
jgi:hypothetical protein